MSVFTIVTREQLAEWLKRYALGTLVDLQGIAAGIENTNYFVTTTAGRFVLTLFEKLGADELPFYLNLMAHLARHGIPCAQPIADLDDHYLGKLNGKPAALVSRLPGADLEKVGDAQCATIGALLARMHLAGRNYTGYMANPRADQWWQSVFPHLAPFLDTADRELLKSETDYQSQLRRRDLPQGVIHADLFRDNVLWNGADVGGIIDFYFSCTDALLYDVAIMVNDWCLTRDGTLDAGRVRATLAAYQQVRPLEACEREAWPALLRAGALRFWVSRLYDYHLPRPGLLTHAKDPGHFRDLLRRHVAAGRDLQRLFA
jgi:homoserine kinase type II